MTSMQYRKANKLVGQCGLNEILLGMMINDITWWDHVATRL